MLPSAARSCASFKKIPMRKLNHWPLEKHTRAFTHRATLNTCSLARKVLTIGRVAHLFLAAYSCRGTETTLDFVINRNVDQLLSGSPTASRDAFPFACRIDVHLSRTIKSFSWWITPGDVLKYTKNIAKPYESTSNFVFKYIKLPNIPIYAEIEMNVAKASMKLLKNEFCLKTQCSLQRIRMVQESQRFWDLI